MPPPKNKRPFWQLSTVFIILILFVLSISYGYEITENTGMMGKSMAGMKASMIGPNITINDLLKQPESMMNASGQGHSEHHAELSELQFTHYITTIIIIVLMPLILAGTVFLTIIWFGATGKGVTKP